MRLFVFLALAVYAVTLSSAQTNKGRRAPLIAQPKKLALTDKVLLLNRNFKIITTPQGLTDTIDLTPQSPFAANKGWIDLDGFYESHVSEGSVYGLGPESSPAPYNIGAQVIVTVQAIRMNKPHLVLIYLNADASQTFLFYGTGIQRTQISAVNGPNVLSCVFIPTHPGQYQVILASATAGYTFFRAEVSVVD